MRTLRPPLAALLLALQGLSGGVVSLLHAAERTSAPAAIEAEHTARCPVLHDAMKCPQCQYAGSHAVTRHARSLLPGDQPREVRSVADPRVPASGVERPAGRPRAPPQSPS